MAPVEPVTATTGASCVTWSTSSLPPGCRCLVPRSRKFARLPTVAGYGSVGSTIRLTMRSRVVLPEPDEPTSTTVWCEGTRRLKSATAVVPSGYTLDTERNSIMRASRPGSRVARGAVGRERLARCEARRHVVLGRLLVHADLLERGASRQCPHNVSPPSIRPIHTLQQ